MDILASLVKKKALQNRILKNIIFLDEDYHHFPYLPGLINRSRTGIYAAIPLQFSTHIVSFFLYPVYRNGKDEVI